MKRLLQLICLLAAAALLPAALLVSHGLPADAHPYVEKKYAGWSGVLRAWICAEWECSGGFMRWLNACAADFEGHHDGVYIEFTEVDASKLGALGDGDVRPPELVLFSPGTLGDGSKFAPLEAPAALRDELRDFGDGRALPVAMGGYIRVYNRTMADGATLLPPDDAGHGYSSALAALLSEAPEEGGQAEPPEELGLDLGLPANAAATEVMVAEDALDRFIAGEAGATVVTQAELARLSRLRDAGKGPDWDCAASGRVAYADQLLLLGVVAQSGEGAQAREALAAEFGLSLLEPAAQARLADVGAFSVLGSRIYSDFSVYAPLDGLLNGRELLIPSSPWASAPANGTSLALVPAAGSTPEIIDNLQPGTYN